MAEYIDNSLGIKFSYDESKWDIQENPPGGYQIGAILKKEFPLDPYRERVQIFVEDNSRNNNASLDQVVENFIRDERRKRQSADFRLDNNNSISFLSNYAREILYTYMNEKLGKMKIRQIISLIGNQAIWVRTSTFDGSSSQALNEVGYLVGSIQFPVST
jgi:hypothetical protein